MKARKAANEALARISRVYHSSLPIAEIDQALAASGFTETEPAIYCGASGHTHEYVGEKTWLSFSWYKMEATGRYEVTAYVS